MKRILSLIISLIMIGNLFQCVSVLASPIQNDLTQNENFVYGDLNNDGDINVFDLMRMKSYVLENKTISYSGKSADVNDDNELSHKDINEMKSYILKNLEAFSFNANNKCI